jgi:hypothetical protein
MLDTVKGSFVLRTSKRYGMREINFPATERWNRRSDGFPSLMTFLRIKRVKREEEKTFRVKCLESQGEIAKGNKKGGVSFPEMNLFWEKNRCL